MYFLLIDNKKTEKLLCFYMSQRHDIALKLDRLRLDPRRELDAHPLHGRLSGKWGCWLGWNLRLLYRINDVEKTIIVESIGTHKIY